MCVKMLSHISDNLKINCSNPGSVLHNILFVSCIPTSIVLMDVFSKCYRTDLVPPTFNWMISPIAIGKLFPFVAMMTDGDIVLKG